MTKETRAELEEMYSLADRIITDLIHARLNKDALEESMALFDAEKFIVSTMQMISCLLKEEE